MVTLQELIQLGKVRGPATRGLVGDISLNNVKDVQSEIRTKHLIDGQTHRHTVITFTLDGSELLIASQANDEPRFKDATTATSPPPRSIPNRRDMSTQTPHFNIETFKRNLEKKADKILQMQLNEHNELQKLRTERAFKNYDKLLNKTLSVAYAPGDANGQDRQLLVPDKLAVKILANNPRIFAEYQRACTESLIEYRAELKRQYRQHLNDIELECRDWMTANRGSNLNVGPLDGLTKTITQATNFEVPLPIVDTSVSDKFTNDILDVNREETIEHFKELASRPVEDGGLSFARESVTLKPLFNGDEELEIGESVCTTGGPTALPVYQQFSASSTNQGSAALSIIDWNSSSRADQNSSLAPPKSLASGTGHQQVQGQAMQNRFANQFTPINRPYISPYAPLPHSNQIMPALVSSNEWCGSIDKSLADRSRHSSPASGGLRSQISNVGNAFIKQEAGYPPYPLPARRLFELSSNFQSLAPPNINDPSRPVSGGANARQSKAGIAGDMMQKTNNVSNPLPPAGIFKLPSKSQPEPRQITPGPLAPVKGHHESLNGGNDEPNFGSQAPFTTANSNKGSGSQNNDYVSKHSNHFVDTNLYNAVYDEEDDDDYVPPPAEPTKPSIFDPNTYVDESLYDEEYVPPPACILAQESHNQNQQQQYFKTEALHDQATERMTTQCSHAASTPPNPFLNETQNMQLDNEYSDQADHERNENIKLSSYEDFDEEEAETSRYLARGPNDRTENIEAIRISSDKKGVNGDETEEEDDEDDYDPARDYHGGALPGEDSDPYGPVPSYFALKPSFGAHIDSHALVPSSLAYQRQGQSLQADLNRKGEDSPLPNYDPTSNNVSWKKRLGVDNRDVRIQQLFKGKTISQIMQMLKDEEAKKRTEVY